ncbi:MAG: sugar ABC transporter substrate-binding protein [Candidatus Rokubacteria bacterium]|nr:sugar ABC transporter substrate-binding protein [Candidatus Rokubacteria bacterium]
MWTRITALLGFLLIAPPVTHAADKVVVMVRTGVEADAIKAVAQAYTKATGRPVETMEIGRSGYYATLHTQLVGGTDAFDLAQANDADVGVLAEATAIAPIGPYLNDPRHTDPKTFDPKDIAFTYSYKGQVYAVPFDVSTHFLYYRKDLVKTPPATWDEYFEEAKRWTRRYNDKSPTLFGAAFTALAGSEQPKVFYSVMWSMGGWIIDAEGRVGVDSPGAIAAAEFYVKLRDAKVIPPDIASWGFSNVKDALETGTIAMAAPYWNAAYPMIKSGKSPFRDQLGIALVPGVRKADGSIHRTPFQQGKILVLNANSKRKDDAWAFYRYLTSKEGMRLMTQAGGTPSRYSLLQDPTLEPREYHELMIASLQIAKGDPAPPFYLKQHEAMNAALSTIISGKGDVKAALAHAAETIRRLQRGK